MTLVDDPALAEDLVQAAIYGLLKRGRAPRRMRPFIFRCLRNAAIDSHRQRRESALDDEAMTAAEPVDDLTEDAVDLRRCLDQLPQGDREIVILKIVAGLTFREIAAVVRRNGNSVATTYRRALTKLRQSLGEAP
jgi:RNA polymerase sigma-70 factor (ECF subfamily)